jgi:hypothetical protein
MDQDQMKYFPKDVVEKALFDLNFHLNQVRVPT